MSEVEEELFAAFILTFRHFHVKNSPTAVGTIRSILDKTAKTANDSATSEEIRRIKAEFDKSISFALEPFDPNGKSIKFIEEDELFDLYLNCQYFHTDVRGAQLFYQLPASDRQKAHKVFQLSLSRYVNRLNAYLPLVVKCLNSALLPKGGFAFTITLT